MMRSIYVIRHTAPAVSRGICYGQSDIDVTETFFDEAAIIRTCLPSTIEQIHSSPLMRCKKLAEHLFPNNDILLHEALMEINCGEWELKQWNDILKNEIDPWMEDFVRISIPGGESYIDLYERVKNCFSGIISSNTDVAIITHGGVIRSILSHITQTPLNDSFNRFSLHYGCVVKINADENVFRYEMLSNIPTPKETHKPNY
jgi:alpha-ribazole phosphatase